MPRSDSIKSNLAGDGMGTQGKSLSTTSPEKALDDDDRRIAEEIFGVAVASIGPAKEAAYELGLSEAHLSEMKQSNRTRADYRWVRICRKNRAAGISIIRALARLVGGVEVRERWARGQNVTSAPARDVARAQPGNAPCGARGRRRRTRHRRGRSGSGVGWTDARRRSDIATRPRSRGLFCVSNTCAATDRGLSRHAERGCEHGTYSEEEEQGAVGIPEGRQAEEEAGAQEGGEVAMGGKKSTHGASGRGDLLMFDPSVLRVITDVKHPQYDPRVEREVDESMVLSIMRLGVIEPLVIVRDGEEVYVVDGRQRRAAAIEANVRLKKNGGEPLLVPCVWRRGDDAKLFEVMVAANEVRCADSPIERARKMQRLADFGRDEEQIAAVFGCTRQTVKAGLALLECATTVQRAVEAGKVPATVAVKLSKLSREEQAATLDEMIAKGATSGAAAHRAVNDKRKGGEISERRRMRSRSEIERVRDGLAGEAARALSWALGEDVKIVDEHRVSNGSHAAAVAAKVSDAAQKAGAFEQ